MNIAEFVELSDSSKHLTDVKPRMFLFQNSRVVEQCPEVTSGYVLHSEIDVLRILEGVKEANQPWCLCGSQDISFNKDVADLYCSYKRSRS